MPLATRVIPSLLCRGRQLVKGKQFNSWRSVGLAAQAVRIHQARQVDEICLLDVGATPAGRGPDLGLVEELSDVMFAPMAVGGGVRSLADVKALLRAGADKVVIGTAAFSTSRLIEQVASAVGSQALVVAVDVKSSQPHVRCGTYPVCMDPMEYAQTMEARGAGEILLTAVEREGTMEGYDIDLIRRVSAAVHIPVIANGGCSGYEDMAAAIAAGASAVSAGALFQFTDATPRGAAQYLAEQGLEVRL